MVAEALARASVMAPEADTASHLGLRDNVSDLPRMQSALTRGTDFISSALESGGTVLVHCHRGISRSPCLAIAYLVRSTMQPVTTVFEKMRARRHVIDPNFGYHLALQEWERRVLPPALRGGRSSPLPRMPTPPMLSDSPMRSTERRSVRPLSRVG